jgi:soluble lytic murein transglycosylase-like protein
MKPAPLVAAALVALFASSSPASARAAGRDAARYTRYGDWIALAAALYDVPEPLVRAIIRCESDYDPHAVSHAGARGLMQLMPDTAARMQLRDIEDPRDNIFAGVRILRSLADEFHGDLRLTIAAYNAGAGAVRRFRGVPPFAETRGYVAAVVQYYVRYRTIADVEEASRALLDDAGRPRALAKP